MELAWQLLVAYTTTLRPALKLVEVALGIDVVEARHQNKTLSQKPNDFYSMLV